MFPMISLAVVAAAAWLTLSPAAADTYRVFGDGKKSCGSWTEARQNGGSDKVTHSAWLRGYLTAFNRWQAEHGDIAASTDMASIVAWVDQYCQQNPLDPISDAAESLVSELEERATPLPDFSAFADPVYLGRPTKPGQAGKKSLAFPTSRKKTIRDRLLPSQQSAPDRILDEDAEVDLEQSK